MKYRDLFLNNPSFWGNETPEPKCLVWSANHEHAVFSLDDSIHPQSKFVWIKPSETPFILCYEKKWLSEIWVFVELKLGNIPLVNNNPFDPRKDLAASNTAESVFPQNIN